MEVMFRDPEGREPSLLDRVGEANDVPKSVARCVRWIRVDHGERTESHGRPTRTE
jgi:hypothetical protein